MKVFLIIYVSDNMEINKYLQIASDEKKIELLKSMDGIFVLSCDDVMLNKEILKIPTIYELHEDSNVDLHIDYVIITGE